MVGVAEISVHLFINSHSSNMAVREYARRRVSAVRASFIAVTAHC